MRREGEGFGARKQECEWGVVVRKKSEEDMELILDIPEEFEAF